MAMGKLVLQKRLTDERDRTWMRSSSVDDELRVVVASFDVVVVVDVRSG